jgi:tetratricopeptide (TPR) repeat protein
LLRKHLDLQLALIREEGDDEVVKTNTVKAHMRAVQLCRLLGEESQANQHAAEARRIANSIDDPSLELQLTLWDLDIHEIHLYIDRREYTSAAEKATAALNSVLSSNLGTDDHTELLIAKFYQQLGMSHEGLSEAEAAEQAYLSGLSALATGAYEHSIESNKLAAHLENSLAVLFNKTGRRNESLRHYESARNRLERLISDDPTRMDLHGLYAIVCSNLANHETRQKNWARAETLYRFAYESQNLVHSNDPKDVFALRNLAQTSGMLASSLARLKRIDEANLYFDRTETFVNQHPHPEKVADVYLRMLNNRARMTKEVLGDPKRAATLWTEAVRWQERNPTQSLTPDIVRSLAMAHEALGKMHLNESEFVQAKEDFTNQFLLTESALSIHPGQHDLVIERMLALENLVEVAVQSDNLLDALKLLEQLAGIADIAGEAVQRAAKGYERILPLALRAVEKGSIQESTLLEIQSRHRELVSASKQDGRSTGNRN